MDVSAELAAHAARFSAQQASDDSPITIDAAILTAFDESPTDDPDYNTDLESYLLDRSTTTTQHLIQRLFTLPISRTPLGPISQLPTSHSHTILPREKHLPKPKPLTKWERFAKEKGISHSRKDKMVWDEDLSDWVPRWGKGGKNKDVEEAWIREVKQGDNADHDPIATARKERKDRIDKNKRQNLRNTAEALAANPTSTTSASSTRPGVSTLSQAQKKTLREARKDELDRSMALSRTATASMGKFDKKIEGEPKIKGVKRKFEPTSAPTFSNEKDTAMNIATIIGKPKTGDADVNVRKALRFQERAERLSGGGGGGRGGGRGGARGGRGGSRGGRGGKR